jgi:integrase
VTREKPKGRHAAPTHHPLTQERLRALAPKDKPYKVYDGRGLFVLVAPTGALLWRYKYRIDGREKLLALGEWPAVSLTQARRLRDEARGALQDGEDPGVQRREQRAARADSFERTAREWLETRRLAWSARHYKQVATSLEQDVYPHLGARAMRSIEPPDVLAVCRRVEARGALDTAADVRQRIGMVYRYAIAAGRAVRNPAQDVVGALKRPQRRHFAAMGRSELPQFFARLAAYQGDPVTVLGLRFIVHTALRTGELRAARWADVDRDARLLRIPAAHMKDTIDNPKASGDHLVPLTAATLALLDELEPITRTYSPLLFPHRTDATVPVSNGTWLTALKRMGYNNKATVHGFRSTFSTIAHEAGFDSQVIDRQLDHVQRNRVSAAYNRSQYLDARRTLMAWWSDFLAAAAGGGAEVVPIRVASAA